MRTNWGMEELFVVESHQKSLTNDQKPKKPVTKSTNTTSGDENAYHISFDKAASVFRMLRNLVTEDLFKASLHTYLKTNM